MDEPAAKYVFMRDVPPPPPDAATEVGFVICSILLMIYDSHNQDFQFCLQIAAIYVYIRSTCINL